MKDNLTKLNEIISINRIIFESNDGKTDLSNLISELTNFKNEGKFFI